MYIELMVTSSENLLIINKMKYTFLLICLLFTTAQTNLSAQITAMPFTGQDCSMIPVNFFNDLDEGKVIMLHFFMPNCGSCPGPAQKLEAMALDVMKTYPDMIRAYAFPYSDSYTCNTSTSWVTSSKLSLYAPMTKGADMLAYYGGFGMPTVVCIGGKDHKMLYKTLSFQNNDVTAMRAEILKVLNTTGVSELPASVSAFSVAPSPASDVVTFNLETKSATNLTLEVLDMTGRRVAVLADETPQPQINVSTWPAGVYLARLTADGSVVTRKFIVAN